MRRSERAALLIMLVLVAALVTSGCLVWLVSAADEVRLLVVDVFVTTLLAALSAFVAQRTGRANANAPNGRALVFFSRRQWMTLMLGLTAVAALTGTGAGFRIVTAGSAGTPSLAATTQPPLPPQPVPLSSAAPSASPSPTPSDTPSTTPSPSTGDGSPDAGVTPAPGATTYLDSTRPVDGGYDPGAISLSGKRYPRSIQINCYGPDGRYIEWAVAGNRLFSAEAGIADDARDASGAVAEMIFYDQDGHQLAKPIDVSVGHPAAISLNLQNVVRLRVVCFGRDAKTTASRSFNGSLGDAVLVNG